jgi:hypothetical protein
MRTTTLLSLCAASLGLSTPALAASKTIQPGLVGKAAFEKKTGQRLDHSHEVYSFANGQHELVWGWQGPKNGGRAANAFMMIVPRGKDRGTMLKETKISGDLAGQGAEQVRRHLTAQGLTGKIELGDTTPAQPHHYDKTTFRLSQAPVTRDSGFLRYTVTDGAGVQKRYLVETNPRALVTGNGSVFGKVFLDTDSYGQKPVK